MKDLQEIRKDIDAIDSQIVELYKSRMKLTTDVAAEKLHTGKQVLDREREKSKLIFLESLADSDTTKHGLRELFEQIMSSSRKRQYQLMTEKGRSEDFGFAEIPALQTEGARIVYQGVEGAYAHLALEAYFGKDVARFHVDTWRAAMEALKSGEADYAVLPFENSSAGIVEENYDLLKEYGYSIVGEQKIKVNHCILGVEGASLSSIQKIYSHPQALAQCAKILEAHPGWEQIPVLNTALAAKKVQDEADVTQAAIASSLTSELYGLHILSEGVHSGQPFERDALCHRLEEKRVCGGRGKDQYLRTAQARVRCALPCAWSLYLQRAEHDAHRVAADTGALLGVPVFHRFRREFAG